MIRNHSSSNTNWSICTKKDFLNGFHSEKSGLYKSVKKAKHGTVGGRNSEPALS